MPADVWLHTAGGLAVFVAGRNVGSTGLDDKAASSVGAK